MFTEVIKKKEKRPPKNRKGAIWLGSVVVGLTAFAGTWALRAGFEASPSNPFAAPQGVVYDQGMTAFARNWQAAHTSGPVTVVEVKETTSQDLGKVPSFVPGVTGMLGYQDNPRAFHARLLQNLKQLGAKVVVFDMVFADEDKKLDPYLAEAIKDHGNVILAGSQEVSQESGGSGERAQLVFPNPEVRADAKGIGIANVVLDTDKTARGFTWWFPGMDEDTAEDTLFPTLGAAAAAAYSGKDPKKVMQEEVQPKHTFLGRPIEGEKYGASERSRMRFYGEAGFPSGQVSVVNYENVLRRGQDEAALKHLRDQIEGKIVLVGDARALSQDTQRVPVISRTSQGTNQQMPGVEIQAHVIQSALNGEYVRVAPAWMSMLLLFVVCMAMALVGRVAAPAVNAGLGVLVIAGLYFGSVRLMAGPGLFLEPVYASVGVAASLLLETGFMYLAERRDREYVKRQLSRHVGKGVAETLTDEEWPELSGQAREITLMFSDLQGFTSLSETMTSQEICSLLNRYFAVVFPILDEHGGTMDKLMGDGMMAYFGFPKRQADHAKRAVECAVAMQKALESWARQPENAGLPPLRTRIGIHTGVATVGEVGAGDRVEFSVIGDVVNVASRLEGMNKDFGTTILISENTRENAGEIAPMTYRGVATVRGRNEPTPVYSVDPGSEATGRHRTSARSASMRVPTTGAAAGISTSAAEMNPPELDAEPPSANGAGESAPPPMTERLDG